MNTDYIHFAYVGKPHGLKGAFFLKTIDNRKIWDRYPSIFLKKNTVILEKNINNYYYSSGRIILELEGINSRNAIEDFYQAKIYVNKNLLCVDANEFLVNDLLNFTVILQNGDIIGEVIGMNSYGAQDNLEIILSASKKIVLYPFVEKYILNIDNLIKQITVEYLPEFLA